MLIKYDGRDYVFDMEDVTNTQLRLVRDTFGGMDMAVMDKGLQAMDADALTAYFWLILQQNNDETPMTDVRFKPFKLVKALNDAIEREKAEAEEDSAPASP